MGDACDRCGGIGKVPYTVGAYRVWVICPDCKGTGYRGPRETR